MKPLYPRRSDYDTEEDFLAAVDDYESWESDYEERGRERFLEEKYAQ